MAILAAMQSAAVRLLGQKPTAFFGSTDTFPVEIADLVNEVAIDVAKYQDWQGLTKFATVATDGVTTAFDLPVDYDRMLKTAQMNRAGTDWFWGYWRVLDVGEFQQYAQTGFWQTPGVWALYGNQLQFTPAPSVNALYPYISNLYATDAATLLGKPAFDADTDTFALPERLLTLGLVWRWNEQKKLDGGGDQEAFIKALDEYASSDKGGRMYRSNSRRFLPGVGVAWPGMLG